MITTTDTMTAATATDGSRVVLHTVTWAPESPPKARVLLIHGYAEHSGRYEHVARRFTDSGFEVHSLDQRGHGRSTGVERGTIDSVQRMVDDLVGVVDRIGDDLPLFVFGHSMGGLLTVLLAERDDSRFAGLVVSAASLVTADSVPAPLMALANLLGRVAPEVRTIALDGQAISRVPEVRADYDADPLNFRGKVTTGTARQLSLGMTDALAHADRITVPILVTHGTADRLAEPSGSVRLVSSVGSDDRTIRLWPGTFHELHNEPESEEFLDVVVTWIDDHL